ncbi:peptidoglycan -binding protein [Thalassovita sp.]|jgi:chemotaxis protein MotB|uniref:peptidoglycan -binding protein n=1 Tax=Thalassovita sp. TaxID=1979401 RepID=UPI003B5AC973
MALSRRTGQRFQASIWPGFVDAMTGLLLVLMFVLTIFMVVQSVLRETITGQENRLDALSTEIAALADALGLERDRTAQLSSELGQLNATLAEERAQSQQQLALIASLSAERDAQARQITDFEAQVAVLLSQRDNALNTVATLEGEKAALQDERSALELALAQARTEIDAGAEAARLAAARREALEALIADLKAENAQADTQNSALNARITDLEAQLSEEEAIRLAEAAAAQALRERLKNADVELTAMTLALEEQRKKAEETLTLLAAAQTAGEDLTARLAEALLAQEQAQTRLSEAETGNADAQARMEGLEASLLNARENNAALEADLADIQQALARALAEKLAAEQQAASRLSDAERQAALLAAADKALANEKEISTQAQRAQALLNQQVAALRTQLGSLQALLDDYEERDAAARVQLESLGSDLNAALARAAAEERKRRQLEEAERLRLEQEKKALEAEKKDLEKYRSDFFGRLREVLGAQEGIRIVGDRFVFSSEVLFQPGSADLSGEGQAEIAKIARILRGISNDIPPEIDWVIRVDGHTDNVPLSGTGEYADNWELSQARALSVVRHMVNFLGLPPDRLSANGFGQYQPVNPADTPEARAQNRRIELKLTEK